MHDHDRSADGCHAHSLREELLAHLPYTGVVAVVGAIAAVVLARTAAFSFEEAHFHASHFAHVASATAAMTALFAMRGRLGPVAVAAIVGGAILLCTAADTLVPWVGMRLTGHDSHLHLCFLEHPWIVLGSAVGGTFLGAVVRRFWHTCPHWFHSVHVLIANVAAILFILSAGNGIGGLDAAWIAVTLTVTITATCVCGDVVIPTLLGRITGGGGQSSPPDAGS